MRKIVPDGILNFVPFEFSICITAYGMKNFKSALLEFPKLFWVDIFRRTRLEAWKLILTFCIVWNIFNSIFLHFVCFSILYVLRAL